MPLQDMLAIVNLATPVHITGLKLALSGVIYPMVIYHHMLMHHMAVELVTVLYTVSVARLSPPISLGCKSKIYQKV